ncbi:flap endonuclease [Kribbella antibiotica]|uniref:5'-3' exonuclease n=1 Tax=Kribbella antibiotica TaxID=190195 RepID=A0A4R4ZXP4_9ACTN|nr:5'-3' exonuclease H3TH domain-containing protein [Kribbella antibiotica]TDD61932.1 flap endonuclease [Kribbella antibiotica]
MLLDTASLYFRAFFGVPDTMKAADGTPTNAIRGLLDFIARLVENHRPTHIVACWDDNWRPSWRVALIPSYKAQRVEYVSPKGEQVEEVPDRLEVQVPYIRACLDALGIAIVGAADHEADDVIGTLSHQARMPVDVVTGDRDLFQLIDDSRGIRVIYTAAKGVGRAEVYDEKALLAKYEIPANRYADFATLRGDASDGLPGVKGVGEKTAASLITTYGDLASIRAAAADPTTPMAAGVKRKILDSADYLDVAPKVVAVAKDAPVTVANFQMPQQVHDPERWLDLVELLELRTSAQRVMNALDLGPKS